MKKHITFALLFAAALTAQAQQGGISGEMLNQIKQSYKATPADKAIRNALGGTSINTLALNQENRADFDTEFSHKVLSKGITDQQSSGRCWLFTGLNVLRSQMIAKYGLDEMEFSQNYCFFYDQLEKANLFLQGIIDTSGKPMDDKMVEWLFKHPLSDGGQFTGVSDIIEKYGLVPKSAMVETFSSENTGKMSNLIGIWFTTTRSCRCRSEAGRTGKEKDRNAGNGLSYAGVDPWRTCFHLYMESEGWRSERIHSDIFL